MSDAGTSSGLTPPDHDFEEGIDRTYHAEQSVVLRYRRACPSPPPEAADARFDELLRRTSIREGLRVLPPFTERGVEVHVLDATSLMHTRSLKSIDGCVTTAQCLFRGHERIVFESGGNTGTALSVYGVRSGLETFFFVPTENVPFLDGRGFEDARGHVIAVDDPREVKRAAAAFGERHGLTRVPQRAWRGQASAFLGCFVLEHILAHGSYHHLVQGISAAFGPIGIYGVLEAHRHRLPRLPAFLGVQQAANCPMVRAWRGAPPDAGEEVASTRGLLARVMYDGQPRTYGSFDGLRHVLVSSGGDLTTLDEADFDRVLARGVQGTPLLELLADRGVHIAQRDGAIVDKTGLMGLVGTLREIASGRILEGARVLVGLTGGTARPDGRIRPELRVSAGIAHVPSMPAPAAGDTRA